MQTMWTMRRAAGVVAGLAMLAAGCGTRVPPMRHAGLRPVRPAEVAPLPDEAVANGALIARHLPRLAYHGGAFLRRPRVVTVTFTDDDPDVASALERFGAVITRTPWWRAVVADYCVERGGCIGEGRAGRAVRLRDRLPDDLHGADLEARLRARLEDGGLGVVDGATALLVYLPARVRLHDAFVPRYCGEGPYGFHRALRGAGGRVAFAVLPRCGDFAALTGTASHELLEMVTNPDTSDRGFAFQPGEVTPGFSAAGLEPMDPCGLVAAAEEPRVQGFVVRRAWSNRAAAAGRDPCVPARRDRPYLALLPGTPGVRLSRAGGTVTVPVTAAADRPAPAWTIGVRAARGASCVRAAFDRADVRPGDVAMLSLAPMPDAPSGRCVVLLTSRVGDHETRWPLVVRLE